MDNEEQMVVDETLDSSEEEEIVLDIEEDEAPQEDIASKLAKAEELAKNYKIRAEKAEREAKNKPEATQSMASRDLIALMNAKVHEEDISEVEDYAKYRGISITEALKSSVVKTLLEEKTQQRNVAMATNTGNVRASSAKVAPETLLHNASKGKLPDDPAELVAARFQNRKK